MISHYTIGVDFGTNSVRAIVVNTHTGEEAGYGVSNYRHGEKGIVTSDLDPAMARQHPHDYLTGLREAVSRAVDDASGHRGFKSSRVIGIGVDATGSTPMPVDEDGTPLALQKEFRGDPNAMAWLWKDHTSHVEAAEITALAMAVRPAYLATCGGTYSSEWFWSKILKCRRVSDKVFKSAATWVELSDWIPAELTGNAHPSRLRRGICAAGHKAMFHDSWGGYPDARILRKLDPELARIRASLPSRVFDVSCVAGSLTTSWAGKLGLPSGIPVSIGALDAHMGAIGSGIRPGTLVKIIGTSTCDIAVASLKRKLPDIPGLCGIVPASVLPGHYGLEAGQAAVGDIFNWFIEKIQPGGKGHEKLQRESAKSRPGESGLLALDWNNGNRTILADQRLTGVLLGTTLHTTPGEVYRALVEATAFGARAIMEHLEMHGVAIKRVVTCGGISVRNSDAMQIYADVLNRPLEISRSTQTCALGAAMCGAVVAGRAAGGHDDFSQAAKCMTATNATKFTPIRGNASTYDRLYTLYKRLHDIFGTRDYSENQFVVMKELLRIRDEVRRPKA